MSIDDLRELALKEDEPEFSDFNAEAERGRDDKIFGMNAVERMFLSVGLFLVVSVLSFLLLLLTDSIALP